MIDGGRLPSLTRRRRTPAETFGKAPADRFDRPTGVRRRPDPTVPEREATADLGDRAVRFTDGPPCDAAYRTYERGQTETRSPPEP